MNFRERIGAMWRTALVGGSLVLLGAVGAVAAVTTDSAAASSPSAIIRGTLQSCAPHVTPSVTLHKDDGRIISSADWHHPSASNAGRRTLKFSFRVSAGQYYLTMNNQYQMPPAARQIDIRAHGVFVTHIVACATNPVRTATPSTASTTTPHTPIGPPCHSGQLSISIQASYVGAGSAAEELAFLNVSNSSCSLDGYPGVAALNSQGQQITQARRSDAVGSPATDVDLKPGQEAQALIQGSDGSIGTCGSFTRSFLVTPPNLTQSVPVTAKNTTAPIAACLIWVYPITPETLQPTSSG
jgi:hypothetical protein